MDTPIDARAAGAARATRRARRHGEHALHDGQGLDGRDAVGGGLAGALDRVDGLDLGRIVHCLELIAVEHERLHVLEHALRSRLAEIAATERGSTPLLKLQEAAKLLAVSRDWLHDHAEEEGLAVHLGGNVVRYDPVAVERLRTRRRRREPPRD